VVGLLKRYRELILVAVLLVLPLLFYFAHAKHPAERSRLDRVILTVTGPLEKGLAFAIVGALDTFQSYVALRHARGRAIELQRKVNLLEFEKSDLERVKEENERLRRLLRFAQTLPEPHLLGARVIGVRLDPKGLQLVTLDRGEKDGIQPMMPVVVGQGVVGRVHTTTTTTADVLVLSDRNSSIAVRIDRSRARANVRGTGVPESCRLEYALRSDDMNDGDLLVTAGTDGVFPRGLPVGWISGLKKGGQGLYQNAQVKPAVDVTKLEEVLVMLQVERPEEAPQTAAAPASGVPVGGKP